MLPHSLGWAPTQFGQQPPSVAGPSGGPASNPFGNSLQMTQHPSIPYLAYQPTAAAGVSAAGGLASLGQPSGHPFLASAQDILRAAASPEVPPCLGLHASSGALPSGYNVPVRMAPEGLLDANLRPTVGLGHAGPAGQFLTSWPLGVQQPAGPTPNGYLLQQNSWALAPTSAPPPASAHAAAANTTPADVAVAPSIPAGGSKLVQQHPRHEALERGAHLKTNLHSAPTGQAGLRPSPSTDARHVDKKPRLSGASSGEHPLSSAHHAPGSPLHRRALASASKGNAASRQVHAAGPSRLSTASQCGSETRPGSDGRTGKAGKSSGSGADAAAATRKRGGPEADAEAATKSSRIGPGNEAGTAAAEPHLSPFSRRRRSMVPVRCCIFPPHSTMLPWLDQAFLARLMLILPGLESVPLRPCIHELQMSAGDS